MLADKFKSRIDFQKFKIKAQNITIIVLTVALVTNSVLTYMAFKSRRTIIIPSVINAALEVSDIDASPAYLRTNIFYALSLLYSYTPDSATARFQEFLVSFVESSKISELRSELNNRLRSIQSVKISEAFEGEEIIFARKGMAIVAGRRFPSVLGQAMTTSSLFLQVNYRILDGNLRITGLREIAQTDYDRVKRLESLDSKKIEDEQKSLERRKLQEEKVKQLQRERDLMQNRSQDIQPIEEFEPDALKGSSFGNALEN